MRDGVDDFPNSNEERRHLKLVAWLVFEVFVDVVDKKPNAVGPFRPALNEFLCTFYGRALARDRYRS